MRILMVPTWYSKHDEEIMSAGVFHYEQAMALKKFADVALYFPFDNHYEGGFYQREERGLLTYRRGKQLSFLRKFFYFFDFIRIIREFKPDIIHGHVASGAGKIVIAVGKLLRIPIVITEHAPIEMMRLEENGRMKTIENVYRNSDVNICVSKDLMVRLKSVFPNEEFKVIYNGVSDPLKVDKDGGIYAVENFINCSIIAGFYDKEIKGYQFLLPALKQLIDEGHKIMLHICGDGVYFDHYIQMAEGLGITRNCIFYGHCDKKKVYSIIEQMDFSISASLIESAGVSVQEALLLGKPVLVTKSGGANSLVSKDVAIIVEKGSVKAIKEGIEQMVEKINSFDCQQIRKYALDNFEMEEVTKRYLDIYQSIVKG